MSTRIEEKDASEILKGIKIPPQPQVLVDIQMEMAMPDFSLDDIAKLISKDVGISGSILKTVNSSYYGLKNRISSISQATSLLGLESIVNIINALSIVSAISNEDVEALTDFWDNAMDLAHASAFIAKSVSSCPPDEAYVLGLFQNAAIPLMLQKFPNYQNVLVEAYANEDKQIPRHEDSKISTNHAVIGYFIARTWKLPQHICDAIADHHNCEHLFTAVDMTECNIKNLLSILKLAEHLCGTHEVIGKQNTDHEFNRIQGPLLNYLGLSDIDLSNIKDDLFDQGIIHN